MPTVKSSMTNKQYEKCQYIIHSAATAAAGGHIIPVAGLAGDMAAMVGMVLLLFDVFGVQGDSLGNTVVTVGKSKIKGEIKRELKDIAESIVTEALKDFGCSSIVGGIADFIPGIGTVVSGSLAIRKIEKVGWKIAVDLYDQNTCTLKKVWHRYFRRFNREIDY